MVILFIPSNTVVLRNRFEEVKASYDETLQIGEDTRPLFTNYWMTQPHCRSMTNTYWGYQIDAISGYHVKLLIFLGKRLPWEVKLSAADNRNFEETKAELDRQAQSFNDKLRPI